MERFNYKWEFRAGRLNAADPLSRAPHSADGSGMGSITGQTISPDAYQLAAVSRKGTSKRKRSSPVIYPPPPPLPQQQRADWIDLIKTCYSSDPPLAKLQRRGKVTSQNGLYFRAGSDSIVYVPAALRLKCLEDMHDTPYSGHKGITKTAHAVTQQYWWPGITADIARYVRACIQCQRNKASNQKPSGLLQPLPVPDDRWSEVTMDFITGFPTTPRGYDAVMVMCDRLTKMVHFAPCHKDTDTLTTAKLFIKHVFANHGLPSVCITDRDTRFTSQLWQHLQQQLGTTHKLSTAFHPQTDGQTERVNRVLEEYLRSFVNSTQSDWDDWLPLAEFAYNNSVHEAVGTTPFHLNYGKAPRLPSTPTGPARFPAADALVTHISDIVARAKKRLQAAADRVKHYADTRRAEHSFTVGQQVLLSTKFLTLKLPGENKLLPKFVGPFTIQQAVGAVSFKLDLPACMKCHPVFHASLLKPYHKDGRYQPPPLPFEIDEEEGLWYEIDAVLQQRLLKRGRRHVLQYLVSFKGYDAAHNQWCDAAGVTQAAIDDYHQRTNTVPASVAAPTAQTSSVTHTTPATAPVTPAVSRSGRTYKPKVRFQI
jgi:hypothetical protein